MTNENRNRHLSKSELEELEELEKSIRKNFKILATEYAEKMRFEYLYIVIQGILCEAVFNSAPTKEKAINLIKHTIDECVRQANEQG